MTKRKQKPAPSASPEPGTPQTKCGMRLWPKVGDLVYPSGYPPHAGRVVSVKPYNVSGHRSDHGFRTVRVRRPNGVEYDLWSPQCLMYYAERKLAQHKCAADLLNAVAQMETT